MWADIGKTQQNQCKLASVGGAGISRFDIGEPALGYIAFGGFQSGFTGQPFCFFLLLVISFFITCCEMVVWTPVVFARLSKNRRVTRIGGNCNRGDCVTFPLVFSGFSSLYAQLLPIMKHCRS